MRKIKKLFAYIKCFKLRSIKLLLLFYINHDKYIEYILKYLKKNYNSLIEEYKDCHEMGHSSGTIKIPVWVCWWQGYDNMPELCKICYQQLKRMLPDCAEVKLITLDNFKNYANIPDYILNKIDCGEISYTHLADVLRWELVYNHGGIWIDSTIFCATEIKDSFLKKDGFWSIKIHRDYKDIENLGQKISKCMWTSFMFKDNKGSKLIEFVRTIFLDYWKNNAITIDYFLQNFIIRLGYEEIDIIGDSIKQVEYSNQSVYELHEIMDFAYDEEIYNKMLEKGQFFKLTWKKTYKEYTDDGKITFYGKLKRDILN